MNYYMTAITIYINYDSIISIFQLYIHSIILHTAHNLHTFKRLIFESIYFREKNARKDLFLLMQIVYFTFAISF